VTSLFFCKINQAAVFLRKSSGKAYICRAFCACTPALPRIPIWEASASTLFADLIQNRCARMIGHPALAAGFEVSLIAVSGQ
jgi:hypothetical protein